MPVDENGEEYIDWCTVLVSHIIRCEKHKKWDCNDKECDRLACIKIEEISGTD
jgi:hypothetical protein